MLQKCYGGYSNIKLSICQLFYLQPIYFLLNSKKQTLKKGLFFNYSSLISQCIRKIGLIFL